MRLFFVAMLLAACGSPRRADEPAAISLADAALADAHLPDAAPPAAPPREVGWLKGNLHVHAAPSGDSKTPVEDVMRWYQERGYDFIALTDHNRITDVDGGTAGRVAVHTDGLIVLAGVELTYNPSACDPPPPELDGKCRIHANVIGPTARPEGKIEWANRKSTLRVDSYQAALDRAAEWGGLVQINHPNWYWGMTSDVLTALARNGVRLVEVANMQFRNWSDGDATHPSVEALWDAALRAGETLWATAADDAHHYEDLEHARYPAGGAWIMVRAARDPDAILQAIHDGRFYASTGVTLARAEVEDGALVVEVAASESDPVITFIGDGRVLAEVRGATGRQPLNVATYVRAVVRRGDGARAWVQPARP